MRPEFSFIITARNESAALSCTLDFLRRQSHSEIILVDDESEVPVKNSFDLTGIRSCQLRQRAGVARAANIGAAMASGKYLFFLDAHVCFNPHFLSEFRETLDRNEGQSIVGCATYMLDDYATFARLASYDPPRLEEVPDENIKERRFGWRVDPDDLPRSKPILTPVSSNRYAVPYVPNCALAVRRDTFTALQGFDSDLLGFGAAQDCEFCARAWTYGYTVDLLPNTICWHYTAPSCGKDYVRDNPLARLDIPKYAGLTLNELRIPFMYFPRELEVKALENVNRRCDEECIDQISTAWMAGFTDARATGMPQRSVRSKANVAALMTTGIGFHVPQAVG